MNELLAHDRSSILSHDNCTVYSISISNVFANTVESYNAGCFLL